MTLNQTGWDGPGYPQPGLSRVQKDPATVYQDADRHQSMMDDFRRPLMRFRRINTATHAGTVHGASAGGNLKARTAKILDEPHRVSVPYRSCRGISAELKSRRRAQRYRPVGPGPAGARHAVETVRRESGLRVHQPPLFTGRARQPGLDLFLHTGSELYPESVRQTCHESEQASYEHNRQYLFI